MQNASVPVRVRPANSGRPWSFPEKMQLARLARGGADLADAARELGRSVKAVQAESGRLGIAWPCDPAGRRRGSFSTAGAEDAAAVVRGVLIARLDDLCGSAEWDVLMGTFGIDRAGGYQVLQAVQCYLFPEEFLEPEERAGVEPGLVPPGGPWQAGAGRMAGYARLLERLRAAG